MLKILPIILSTIIFSGYSIESLANQGNDLDSKNRGHRSVTTANGNLLSQDRVIYARDSENFNDSWSKILILIGLTSGVGIAGWYLSRFGQTGWSNTVTAASVKNKKKALIDRVSPRLRRKLLRLINDPKTANRLLMGIYQHHRDRSPDWIAEKVIYDLQRGR